MNLTLMPNCLSVMAQELIRKTQGVLIQSKIIQFLHSLTQLNILHKRLMTVEKTCTHWTNGSTAHNKFSYRQGQLPKVKKFSTVFILLNQ